MLRKLNRRNGSTEDLMSHPVHPGHEAAEPPEKIETREQEREKENENESEQERKDRDEALREHATEVIYNTNQSRARKEMKASDLLVATLDRSADNAMSEDRSDASYSIEMKDLGSSTEISGLRKDFAEYKADKLLAEKRADRSAAKYFIAAAVLGLAVSVPTIVDIVHHWNDNKEEDDAAKKEVMNRIKQWRVLSDETFWLHVADLTDSEKPSKQEMIVWLDFIKEICQPLKEPWEWHDDDALEFVDYVLNIYNKNTNPKTGTSRASCIFRALPDLEYNYPDDDSPGVPLPRQVAADIAQLAIYKTIEV